MGTIGSMRQNQVISTQPATHKDSLPMPDIWNFFSFHIGRIARIELTNPLHSSLFSIALGRSASCALATSVSSVGYVLSGLPTLALPCLRSQSNTSLTNSSFLLNQCPAKCLLLSLIIEEIQRQLTIQSIDCWVRLTV